MEEKKVNAHLTRTVISDAGIRPNKVPKKKVENGTSTIGDAKLMNVFGSVGVTRRNSMKFNNLSLCWAIWLKSFAYFTSSYRNISKKKYILILKAHFIPLLEKTLASLAIAKKPKV